MNKLILKNLFLDHKYTKKITLADSKQIKELKLKEGETIFLQNSSKPQNQKNKKNENQKSQKTENIENSEKITPKCNHSENEVLSFLILIILFLSLLLEDFENLLFFVLNNLFP